MPNDSKSVTVAVICIILSAVISGTFVYNRIRTTKQAYINTELTSTVPSKIIPTSDNRGSFEPTQKPGLTTTVNNPSSNNALSQAKIVLEDFFVMANKGNYEKAADLLGWKNMETADLNQWPGPTYAKTLENYCRATNTCLKVKNATGEKITEDEYRFTVSFRNNDGSVFSVNPPAGLAGVPATNFIFKVKKIDGVFKLLTPPVFRP